MPRLAACRPTRSAMSSTGKVKPETSSPARVVLIGATAPDDAATSVAVTPVGPMPRVEVTANALSTILDRSYVRVVGEQPLPPAGGDDRGRPGDGPAADAGQRRPGRPRRRCSCCSAISSRAGASSPRAICCCRSCPAFLTILTTFLVSLLLYFGPLRPTLLRASADLCAASAGHGDAGLRAILTRKGRVLRQEGESERTWRLSVPLPRGRRSEPAGRGRRAVTGAPRTWSSGCGPATIAVIDHADLDALAARALADARVAAVVNAQPFISGKYPNRGPAVLRAAGMPAVPALRPGPVRPLAGGRRAGH